jgi:hypothetical protein
MGEGVERGSLTAKVRSGVLCKLVGYVDQNVLRDGFLRDTRVKEKLRDVLTQVGGSD